MFFGIGGHFTDAIKMMFDTTKFFSDKASLLVNMVEGARTGQDWRNRSYTTIREWMGLTGDDTQDPLRFSLVKDEPSHGVISTSQIPSYALSQFGNLLPIPIDNLISHFQGELDGIQMFGKDLGGKFVLKKLYTPMVQGIHQALKSMTPLGTPQSREEAKAKRDLFDIIKIEHDPSKFYGKVWEKVNEGVINDTTAEHMIERGVNMAADPQWAELKYQLGEIAKNNFLQALQIVEKGSPLEQQVMKQVLYQHTESIKDPSKIGEYFKRMNQLGGKK